MSEKNTGRVTIPTNLDVVPETIELMKRWGADAIRDCDGTEFPEELTKTGAKIYATYYTTRKDNEWAKANPDEVQQCYIMSGFYTAVESELQIPLMKGISDELMQVNTRDDIKRWWEVVDRSTGQVVSTKQWEYNEESGCVCIHEAEPFHEYTVSFLAYIIWDPVHMYNAVTNDWKDFEHQKSLWEQAASAGAMPAASAAEKRREIKVLSSMIPSSLSADRQAADADGRLADVGRHAAAERAAHALAHRHVLTDAVNAH